MAKMPLQSTQIISFDLHKVPMDTKSDSKHILNTRITQFQANIRIKKIILKSETLIFIFFKNNLNTYLRL